MKTPAVNEVLLGVEHEVMPAFVVGLGGTYRHLGNFLYYPALEESTGRILTPADYDCAAAGPYPVPNGTPQMINACSLNPGIHSKSQYQTNRPGYYQTYWSIDLSATKRYSDKWMARFNFTYMNWTQHGLAEEGPFQRTSTLSFFHLLLLNWPAPRRRAASSPFPPGG